MPLRRDAFDKVRPMAAPSFVPVDPTHDPRWYDSAPRRPESWTADRPGEIVGMDQPRGGLFGNQGPDIGYALKLVHLVTDKIHLTPGESMHDTEAGIVAVAMRRASLFGRAPILADLDVACTVWGFYDEQPAADLLSQRKLRFEAAGHHFGYDLTREIAASVPDSTLRRTPAQITEAHRSDWASLLDLD